MQQITLKIRGLYTHPSDLSSAPEGALSVADNLVIDHEDIAEPRRGYGRSHVAFTNGSDTAKKLATYQDYLFAHLASNILVYYTTKVDTNSANFTGSGAWTPVGQSSFTFTVTIATPAVFTATAHGLTIGTPVTLATSGALPTGLAVSTTYYVIAPTTNTFELSATLGGAAVNTSGTQNGTHTLTSGYYSAPSGTKMRFAEANKNLYFTSSAGVYKLDAYTSTPVKSGAVKGLDLQASTTSATGNWLPTSTRVAYRVVWGYKDTNKNLILGAPSQIEAITNTTSATCCISLAITIPANVTTAWFYQVYRSGQVTQSGSTVIDPNDELRLVYESNPTSGQISAKTLTVTDIVPEELRNGAVIYTASSQEGLANGNEQPPLAKDIAVFRNVTFFGNTVSKNRQYVSLLAAGGTNGIALNDTITVGGISYAGKSTELASGAQFRVYSSGTLTATISNASPGVLTATAHGLSNGDPVTLTTSGALPAPLASGTTYFVVAATANTFELATTLGGTAINTTTAGSGTHTVVFGGSVSQNIHNTAVSLVRVINQYASSTVYAYYLSGPDSLPGQLLFEERSLGGGTFTTTSTNTTCWSPTLSGSGQTSTADTLKNGLFYSKTSQPEAVPLPNYFYVGSADKEILRILPLRDSLFILKQDGIFRLSGQDISSFRVDLFDSTTHLLAPDTAVVLNNTIFALTDQGVVSVSESGVQVKSRPIEFDLLSLQGANYTTLQTESFGVSYETERKYVLFVPSLAADTTPTQAYVFNTFTTTWTRWPLSKTCGLVNRGDDKLYLGDAATAYVNQERKSFSYQDYVDYGFATNITAVNGTVLTIDSADQIAVGDVIYQSSTVYSTVSAVDTVAGTVTTTVTAAFSVASTDVLKAISSAIAWVPFTAGNPGLLKQFREVSVLFKSDFTGNGTLVFSSDTSPALESETLVGTGIGTWGLFSWGMVGWGGTNRRRPIRVYVPTNKQRCSQLTIAFQHSTGYAKYQLNGVSIVGNVGSEKVAF